MIALASMLQATQKVWYLDRLKDLVAVVIANSDSARGVRDWTGMAGAGWSTTHYSANGERVRGPVGDAMAVYALVRASESAQSFLESTNDTANAKWWREALRQGKQALMEDRSLWRDRDGRMMWPEGFPRMGTRADVPINQDLMFAAAELRVRLSEKASPSRGDSLKAKRFLGVVRFDRSEAAMWPYWWPVNRGDAIAGRYEDVSHAGLDVLWATEAYRANLLPDTVMRALGRTFETHFAITEGLMSYFVGASPRRTPPGLRGRPGIALWLVLRPWSNTIPETFCSWLQTADTPATRPKMIERILVIGLLANAMRE